MNTDTAVAEEPDEDGPPRRSRAQAAIAFASEPIPYDVNAAFLADLAFERAISTALGLANGPSGPVGWLSGLSGPDDAYELPMAVLEPGEAAL